MQYAHAGGSGSDDMLLMANTQSNNEQTNMWYLDSGCSNHMTGNKNSFTKLDESIKKVIRSANGRHVTLSGKVNIATVRKDGKRVSIADVLYVPSMTSNLISIYQLISKGYNSKLEKILWRCIMVKQGWSWRHHWLITKPSK